MDIARFRAIVAQRLTDVLERNARVNERLRRTAGLPDDWEERAVVLEDDEVLEGLDAEGRAEIAAAREALRRMDDGTYGRCARCGAPIAEARLRALPYALTCVSCAAS
jgi:RNA polymerase-binding transcription factor DksA